MRYPKGNAIAGNVVEALRLTGKIGFLSQRLWCHHYAQEKARRARYIQIQRLGEKGQGLLRPHPNPAGRGYFVLSERGQFLLEREGLLVVSPVPVAQLYHDELIADSMIRLEREKILVEWKSEPEMKKAQLFALNSDPVDKKYPDAVIDVLVQGEKWNLALEYERTRKSALRYKDILWLYARLTELKLVIFICESPAIENAIRGQLKRLALPRLYGRVAFVEVDAWQANPTVAKLQLEDRSFTLAQICQKQS